MTQREIIKRILADSKEWIPSYKLMMVETAYGWVGSQGDRRARELAEAGEIERKQIGKYAHYKTKEKVCTALTKIMEIRAKQSMSEKTELAKRDTTPSLF